TAFIVAQLFESGMALATLAPAFGTETTGAGSTFVYPNLAKWAADYAAKTGNRVTTNRSARAGRSLLRPFSHARARTIRARWRPPSAPRPTTPQSRRLVGVLAFVANVPPSR